MMYCLSVKLMQKSHNPYFNRWFSAIQKIYMGKGPTNPVTILILIDGFLQFYMLMYLNVGYKSHNPYFNRWFSAIAG